MNAGSPQRSPQVFQREIPGDSPGFTHVVHKFSTMHFSLQRDELDRMLAHVARVVTVRHSLPVLGNVLIETDAKAVRLSGTDLEIAASAQVAAEVLQEGAFTVPAKVLQEFVHQVTDRNLTVKREGQELVIIGESAEGRIVGLEATEYPSLPEVPDEQRVVLPGTDLATALKQVVLACAADSARPVLTSVLFRFTKGQLTLVATDSFRLTERTLALAEQNLEIDILVPHRTVQEMLRILGNEGDGQVSATIGAQQVIVTVGGVELTSRLIVGQFPAYQRIIPDSFVAELDVAVAELQQALRLTSIFSHAGVSNVLFQIGEEGSLTLQSHGSTRGRSQHAVHVVPQPGLQALIVAFNTRFVLDALSVASDGFVRLRFAGATKPLVVATEDTSLVQLVMPIRLDT